MDFADSEEVGRRIAAARGYHGGTIESFAAELGISAPTLRSYEHGKLGDYSANPQLRRALLERVREAANAPAEILGLSEPGEAVAAELERRLDELEKRTLPRLRSELLAEMSRELGLRDAQRKLPEPGDQAEGVTGG